MTRAKTMGLDERLLGSVVAMVGEFFYFYSINNNK